MRYLLDTHIAIWAILEPEKLSSDAALRITSPEHNVYISIVSLWEIAIKRSTGQRGNSGAIPPVELAAAEFASTGFELLPISLNQLAPVETMPFHHRDPFDRLMVAQAAAEGMTFLTADRKLAAYGDHVRVM
jgi:PIN domain nuclease of toxin-antitoxin system